ncbi:MAG TPA: RCC1 domain-containing protein [Polyangia bacterium]
MSVWRRWIPAGLLAAIACAGGCERRLLGAGPVDRPDAATDLMPSPPPPDAAGTIDGGPSTAPDGSVPIDGASGSCPVTQAPAGTFGFLSAGNDGTCGVRTDGTLACWGYFYTYDAPQVAGTVRNVSRQLGVAAVLADGSLGLWGAPASVLAGPAPAGVYQQAVVGEDGLCARAATAKVSCWGHAGYAPGQYQFVSLAGGAYAVCGLEASQQAAVCWDPRVGAETVQVQPGPFMSVDAGRFFVCGLGVGGSVTCWATIYPPLGPNDAPAILSQAPPAGPFRELSVGDQHACALRSKGEVVCWGEDRYGQATPPDGLLLAHVSAGATHTCGIRSDGTVICWGGSPTCLGPP